MVSLRVIYENIQIVDYFSEEKCVRCQTYLYKNKVIFTIKMS